MMDIISLGAGVQSSTMALMAAKGEIGPMPTAAIFSDTKGEPQSVYRWLDWLEKQLPFPVYRVERGDLAKAELVVRRSGKSGKLYLDGSIPAFVKKPDGGIDLLGRKCTADFKVVPIQRKVKELVGIKRAGKKIVFCRLWLGISRDEMERMKQSRVDYIQNIWPLVDAKMKRNDCLLWMKRNGFPVPPRSACAFCPFHSDEEWQRLKVEEPEDFAKVVRFEADLQKAAASQEVLKGVPFLHSTCAPIGSIDFTVKEQPAMAQVEMFKNECEGLCGV